MRVAAPRLRRAVAVFLATGLLAASAAAWRAAAGPSADPAGSGAPPAERAEEPTLKKEEPAAVPTWKDVETLVENDQMRAALETVEAIFAAAQTRGDAAEWTRALIEAAKLEIALGEFETAAERLRGTPWPEGVRHRLPLQLAHAEALVIYLHAYRWEIVQRERVAAEGEGDLRTWTVEQISAEAQRAFLAAWQGREEWGEQPVTSLERYLEPDNFPAGIRDRLRDAVSYLWADLLADTSLWTPVQDDAVYRLDLEPLLAGEALDEEALGDAGVHPLRKLAAALGDLERWHAAAGRPEASFEALRMRLRHLWDHFDDAGDRAAIRAALERGLDLLGRARPWWSMGTATLAWMIDQGGEPDARVRALEVAREGAAAHPESVGGQYARHLAESIVAPSYSIVSMAADGPGRRSIQVTHKDLARLRFRAYRLDLPSWLARSASGGRLLPDHRDVPTLLERKPDAAWTVELPATPDHRPHHTYVTPPFERPGLWVVVASAAEHFRREGNAMQSVNLMVTGLVLVSRSLPDGIEVTVRSGSGGEALEGLEVALYRFDWRHGHPRVAAETTSADGVVTFRDPDAGGEQWPAYFPLARRGEDAAVDLSHLRPEGPRTEVPDYEASLVYTDRSVYRPGQEVLWKVVAIRTGAEGERFGTLPGRTITVELSDPNGQAVGASETVETNEYGSASGRFTVPSGRPLGVWFVRSSMSGAAQIRVEEYKRPTFEVTVAEPPEPLRLNREARLTGEARYYFGLPVAEGRMRWTVAREPVFPWWWWWWDRPTGGSRIVAAGEGELGADGGFEVVFTPEADERDAGTGVSYRFRLEAAVTDPGGETRTAARAFRLGFVAVEARVDSERGFWNAGEEIELPVVRTDLDGTARAGTASWTLLALDAPEETPLPAELPVPQPPPTLPPGAADDAFRTAGDRLRPRWQHDYRPERVLALWPDGERIAAGDAEHGDDGRAVIELPALAAGAYRVRYRTEDGAGSTFEMQHELVVAADGATPLPLPAVLLAERPSVAPGGTARLFVHSGIAGQPMVLELFRGHRQVERRTLAGGGGGEVIEIPIGREDRGGFGVRLTALADYQLMSLATDVMVPWDDRELEVEFATFRDLLRPGQRETWRVTVRGEEGALEAGAAELLAYMYDRSLDLFAPHQPPAPLAWYPQLGGTPYAQSSLGVAGVSWRDGKDWGVVTPAPVLVPTLLEVFEGYGIGGPGWRGGLVTLPVARSYGGIVAAAPGAVVQESLMVTGEEAESRRDLSALGYLADAAAKPAPPAPPVPEPAPAEPVELRSDFAETAFWEPHLVLGEGGEVGFEFTVPEAVTEWSVWVHALTRDLRAGSLERRTRTVKELLVRPYVPRFLREGDRAELRVAVNNSGEETLTGTVEVRAVDPESGEDRSAELGLGEGGEERAFTAEPDGGATVTVPLTAPRRVGAYALEVTARAGGLSDGERRPLPVLPGRVHLAQSRFAALRDADRRVLAFPDLAAQAGAGADPTLITDRLIVTLDGQLFYSVLSALPYLIEYPYECTEQTLNRFVSTAIVGSVFERYPAVAAMAKELAGRETRFEAFDEPDPNRDLLLEETPWLRLARGGSEPPEALIKALDPEIAATQRDAALASLAEAQTSSGGFPWWPGGPPSPYMTVYILQGLSRALERGAAVPAELTAPAWRYLHVWWTEEARRELAAGEVCCIELVTFLNYVLSSYPESGEWTGGVFTERERATMLERSWKRWRAHSPRLKVYLALTLARAGRDEDATRVFDSVMDSSRTDRDLGTYWAPEERAWLWYNDTVETHALALAALTELAPDDPRRDGLVQWLFLNKKLNHWKSTRATAEAIWALVESLEEDGVLGAAEAARVIAGPIERTFRFEPDEYTGKGNQVVIPGTVVDPATMSEITVEKETPGLLFASATWHFSTEQLPEEAAEGGLFTVRRSYFRRLQEGDEWVLLPLAEGERIEVGDQLEVHLSVTARHAAEYVHLRDPRGAGFEPETLTSGYRWELGLARYEEIRDSGTNFFIEWLPAGEYTLKHRLRAATAGTFRTGPATLQSMYAPEFTAYSSGAELAVVGE